MFVSRTLNTLTEPVDGDARSVTQPFGMFRLAKASQLGDRPISAGPKRLQFVLRGEYRRHLCSYEAYNNDAARVTAVPGFTYKYSRAGVPAKVPGSSVTNSLPSSDLISSGR